MAMKKSQSTPEVRSDSTRQGSRLRTLSHDLTTSFEDFRSTKILRKVSSMNSVLSKVSSVNSALNLYDIGDEVHLEHVESETDKPSERLEDSIEAPPQTLTIMWAIGFTIVGGCSATSSFELLTKADRGCADFILFWQNIYTLTEAACTDGLRTFFVNRQMPWACHFGNAAFETVRNALFNMAIGMGLPMPMVLVIKNSGLVVSVIFGATVQRKSYGWLQLAGVLSITVGIILATFASKPPAKKAEEVSGASIDSATFMLATGVMLGGVVVTAIMNVVQEAGFRRYGSHFQEAAFYSSALSLPMSLLKTPGSLASHFSRSIAWSHHFVYVGSSLLPFGVPVPSLWLLLLVTSASAALMKISCIKLTGIAGQVANTVTVVGFRFVCLILSACVFNAPPFPPLSFWAGGIMVLGGTLAYALLPPAPARHQATSKDKKEQ